MSFLTPVYLAGALKGIVMVDVNRDNLKIFFIPVTVRWFGAILT